MAPFTLAGFFAPGIVWGTYNFSHFSKNVNHGRSIFKIQIVFFQRRCFKSILFSEIIFKNKPGTMVFFSMALISSCVLPPIFGKETPNISRGDAVRMTLVLVRYFFMILMFRPSTFYFHFLNS